MSNMAEGGEERRVCWCNPSEGRFSRGKRMLCKGRRKLGMRVRRAKASRSSKKRRGRRHADLLNAIDHPRRRRILRMLNERDEPCNPIEIALKVEGPLGLIAYHIRVLRELGAVERVSEDQDQDSIENFYESRIGDDPSIEAMLEEAREDDEEDEDEEDGKEES